MEKQIEKKQEFELIKSGQNFLGILNDIKRRPEDAANELGISTFEQKCYNNDRQRTIRSGIKVSLFLSFYLTSFFLLHR